MTGPQPEASTLPTVTPVPFELEHFPPNLSDLPLPASHTLRGLVVLSLLDSTPQASKPSPATSTLATGSPSHDLCPCLVTWVGTLFRKEGGPPCRAGGPGLLLAACCLCCPSVPACLSLCTQEPGSPSASTVPLTLLLGPVPWGTNLAFE